MVGKQSKNVSVRNKKAEPTVKHASSADSAQDIGTGNSAPPDKNSRETNSARRTHNGSDGSSNAGRGSNH